MTRTFLLMHLARTAMLFMLALPAMAGIDFQFDPGSRSWTLSNGKITAAFQLTPDGKFLWTGTKDISSGREWAPPSWSAVAPFKFVTSETPPSAPEEGEHVAWEPVEDAEPSFATYSAYTGWTLAAQSSEDVERGGRRQTIVLDDIGGRARVTLELELYPGQRVVRHRARLQNLRSAPVWLVEAELLPWTFSTGSSAWLAFRVNQWVRAGKGGNFEQLESLLAPGGAPVTASSGAYGQHASWLALAGDKNEGVFLGWEFNGRADVSAAHFKSDRHLEIAGGITDLHHPLGAEEEFPAPWSFIGFFDGQWDDASAATHSFVESAIAHPLPGDDFPYVMWNSWGLQTSIDEAGLRKAAAVAASLGVEVFVIDYGWARELGDWRHDPAKFPNGLRPLADYVHSLGMKFGLHYALVHAMEDSPILRKNPDWTSSRSYGYFMAESLCLSHKPVRDWLIGETLRIIDEYAVDWIVQDGENMVKFCDKGSHTHHPQNSNYSNSTLGLDYIIDEVRRQRPGVLWENCEDGGNMMTYAMTGRYVTSINSDNDNALVTRRAVYGATYPFPPRYTGRYMEDTAVDSYIARSFMYGGGPWILMNRITALDNKALEYTRSQIELYKSLRAQVRRSRVFHLLPPAENRYDALQSLDPATGASIIFAIKEQGADRRGVTLRPKGLEAHVNYRVSFQDRPTTLFMSGRQLMENGLPFVIQEARGGEIVYLRPQQNENP